MEGKDIINAAASNTTNKELAFAAAFIQRQTLHSPKGKPNKQINNLTMKKKVGQVTPEEKNEIQQLFERRNGLNELAKILNADNTELYEKLVKDMGETGTKFQGWWDRMSQKYQWESAQNGSWEINFETNEIYLVS